MSTISRGGGTLAAGAAAAWELVLELVLLPQAARTSDMTAATDNASSLMVF